jgi:hypothetical protein
MLYWGAFVQPLLLWESNKCYIFWVCVYSLWYPATNAHSPYCHLCPARPYNTFHSISQTVRFFGGGNGIDYQIVCFDFLYNFHLKHFSCWEKFCEYDHKYILAFMWSSRCYCQILMKLECYRLVFKKHHRIKFNHNLSGGNPVASCGRTDMTKFVAIFRNFAS